MSDRKETIKQIRQALKVRSNKTWSVTGGTGTAYGWLTISAPPARRDEFGRISESDQAELKMLLALDSVHTQGVSIPASSAYYQEYIDRAEGRTPSKIGTPYWD
jgi:hypothetical protein